MSMLSLMLAGALILDTLYYMYQRSNILGNNTKINTITGKYYAAGSEKIAEGLEKNVLNMKELGMLTTYNLEDNHEFAALVKMINERNVNLMEKEA